MDFIAFLVVYIIACIYVLSVFRFLSNDSIKKKRIVLFHNAILSIYDRNKISESMDNYIIDDLIEQIKLNYNKIFQNEKESDKTMLLDMLEQIIFYYDAYTNKNFEKLFAVNKNFDIRNFVLLISQAIKENDPFSALPTKEATLLKNIDTAIVISNIELGKTAIEQLSAEILNKEAVIKKQEYNNRIATVLSVIGMILTVFFGILSLF